MSGFLQPEAVDGESAEGGGANNEDEAGEGSENEESGELDLEGIDDEEIDRVSEGCSQQT